MMLVRSRRRQVLTARRLALETLEIRQVMNADLSADYVLTLLHNNDGESKLIPANPSYGGASRFVTLVNQLKDEAASNNNVFDGDGVLTVSSGDNFLAGTAFSASLAQTPPVFYDAKVLDAIGYDAIQLGNHDFDFGPEILAQFIAQVPTVPYLAANLDFSGEPALAQLVADGRIRKSVTMTAGGQQIGIVGAVTSLLPVISSPGNVQLIDANTDGALNLEDVRLTVQAEIDVLQAAGVNKVILVSHLQDLNEELALAGQLQGIDVVVAGGSDSLLANAGDLLIPGDTADPVNRPFPIVRTNADGDSTLVVTTTGEYRYVGRLRIGFDVDGKVIEFDGGPVRVSGVVPDAVATNPTIESNVIQPVQDYIAGLAANILASSQVPLDGVRNSVRTRETNLGNLIADALRWQALKEAASYGLPTAANRYVAIQNGGGIRNNSTISVGNFSELDTFNILPFDNFVSVTPSVAPAKLKELLENAVSNVEGIDGRFAQVSGMRIVYDLGNQKQIVNASGVVTTPGNRIQSITLDDGTAIVKFGQVQAGAPHVNVASINFLARGGDGYPFAGAPFTTVGVSYQQALANYISSANVASGIAGLNGVIAASKYPVGGNGRIQQTNPAAAPTPIDADAELGVLDMIPASLAEIGAFDPDTSRFFLTGGTSVQVIDGSNPYDLQVITTLSFSGRSVNHITTYGGLVAVAVEGATKTSPGKVEFFSAATLQSVASVEVGALPDMLVYTPDGGKLLVANEGEPEGATDPAGSISVINVVNGVPEATATTLGFAGFDPMSDKLRAQGVRLFPGKMPSVDFEPEFISISPDGSQAVVTLQEANAFAILDLTSATPVVARIVPLGLKDHALGLPELKNYQFNPASLPNIGTTPAGQILQLGGFSGLYFEGIDATTKELKFITHTDRGPNGEPTDLVPGIAGAERPFALPGFQPRLVRFRLNQTSGQITITEQILLQRTDGSPLSGLPNLQSATIKDETPIDLNGNVLSNDPFGADLEGIVVAPDGTFWMVDEYRPAIYHFAADGKLLERYVPEGTAVAAGQPDGAFGCEVLPSILGTKRRANRGFEAIAFDAAAGKLYAFMQTTLDNPDTSTNNVRNNGNVRIVEFDIATETVTAQYVYVMRDTTGSGDARTDKLGDAVYLGGGKMLVAERDDRTGSDSNKLIYEINLVGATNIVGLPDPLAGPASVAGQTIEQLNATELVASGIRPVSKRLVTNVAALGYTGVSKLEGLARIDANTFAIINDNDFGIAPETISGNGSIPLRADPEPIQVGILDFTVSAQLDASDRDSAVNLQSWPVFGMYMPDGVASFASGGQTYYITGNEGDARTETARIKDLSLDPVAFPHAGTLKLDHLLGRLTASNIDGDLDGDGDLDRLQLLGGRSFSIWDAAGNLVWDSGDQFERLTAELTPNLFNANDGLASRIDERSDDKGPEPEGVAIGSFAGRTYAFIGLERSGGGIMMYDVTNPLAPAFVQYLTVPGDVSPEGLLFVEATQSPTGLPLLAVTNEVSGTFSVLSLFDTSNADPVIVLGSDSSDVTVRRDGEILLVVNAAGEWLFQQPIHGVNSLTIQGLDRRRDTVTVDLSSGPISLPGGLAFSGGGGRPSHVDTLRIVGTMGNDLVAIDDAQVFVNGTVIALNGIERIETDLGAGDDEVHVRSAAFDLVFKDLGGSDKLDFSHAPAPLRLNLRRNPIAPQVALGGRRLTVDGTFEAIFGTPFDDRVYAGQVPVMVFGQEGNDELYGLRGDVVFDGGPGDDRLFGGAGNDVILGGEGNDQLSGGGGDDYLDGGAGNDDLRGGGGNDLLFGDAGRDELEGEGGHDVLVGGTEDGELEGGTGRDLLIGGLGADELEDNYGEDILIGGTTAYDASDAALRDLISIWGGPGDLPTRVGLLTPQLNASTVFDDGVADELDGDEFDWFFAFPNDDVRRRFRRR